MPNYIDVKFFDLVDLLMAIEFSSISKDDGYTSEECELIKLLLLDVYSEGFKHGAEFDINLK